MKYDDLEYFKALTNPTSKTIDLTDEDNFKGFKDFVVLKFFSQFRDSFFLANEINQRPQMDNRLKLYFFINTLRKRFRKIGKFKFSISEDVKAIMEYYDYNEKKA